MDWTNLSSGLFGAAVGGVTTFGAAAFTMWRSRLGDQRRDAIRETELEHERRDALVGEVVASLRMIEMEVRWAPFLKGRTVRHFLKVSMTFYASQRRAHPNVASWLQAQIAPYQETMQQWHRVCLVPVWNRRRLERVGKATGELCAAIVGWAAGDIPDEAFEDSSRSPIEVARIAGGSLSRSTRLDQ